jgi:hypothetical protein
MFEQFLTTGHKGEQELILHNAESIRIWLTAPERISVMQFSYDDKLNAAFASKISVLALFSDKLIVAIDSAL